MPKKRPRNDFLDGEAQEDSGEESDTEKKQRALAIKKLKNNRPRKFFRVESVFFSNDCFFPREWWWRRWWRRWCYGWTNSKRFERFHRWTRRRKWRNFRRYFIICVFCYFLGWRWECKWTIRFWWIRRWRWINRWWWFRVTQLPLFSFLIFHFFIPSSD